MLFSVYQINWTEEFNSNILDLQSNESIAYILTVNNGLYVYDISNEYLPLLISHYPNIESEQLVLDNNFAYTINDRLITRYNISNPENIFEIGSFTIPQDVVQYEINKVYIKNNLLFVGSYDSYWISGLFFIDAFFDVFNITNINDIEFLLHTFGSIEPFCIFYLNNQNYLYTTNHSLNFIKIYDCNDVNNIHFVSNIYLDDSIELINENYVITLDAEIFEFVDIENLQLVDSLGMSFSSTGQKNNLIFFTNYGSLDFYDLNSNQITAHFSYPANTIKPIFADNILLIINENSLANINISDPINPYLLWEIRDNFAYFQIDNERVYYRKGCEIHIIPLDNPLVYITDIPAYGSRFKVSNNVLITYFYNTSTGLTDISLYDTEQIENPIFIDSFTFSNVGNIIYFENNCIYSQLDNHLTVISILDIFNPEVIYELNFSYNYESPQIIKNDSNLFLISNEYCAVIDLNNTNQPEILIEYEFVTQHSQIDKAIVSNNILYFLPESNESLIYAYDFSDILNPQFINVVDLELDFDISMMDSINDKIVISSSDINSIFFYAVDNNNLPILAREFKWNNRTYYCVAHNDYLLVSVFSYGLNALSNNVTPISEIEIINTTNQINFSNYPNPFNPTTTISFSIPNKSKVDLTVYNIKGQKVKTLANNEFEYGDHSIVWGGDNESGEFVGSGIYLYKLNVNGKIKAVKKCLLLK